MGEPKTVVLTGASSGIGAAAAPGATVILSGLMADQQNQVVAAYAEQGFRLADVLAEEEWRTLVLER